MCEGLGKINKCIINENFMAKLVELQILSTFSGGDSNNTREKAEGIESRANKNREFCQISKVS